MRLASCIVVSWNIPCSGSSAARGCKHHQGRQHLSVLSSNCWARSYESDEAALRGIIQRQRKIAETSKKLEMKKLYQVLIILDDCADSPQLHKPHGALDMLFIPGRHTQISTWVSSQKLRLISRAGEHEAARPARAGRCQRTSCTGSTSRGLGNPTASSSSTTSSQRIKCSTRALKSVSHWKEKPMGALIKLLIIVFIKFPYKAPYEGSYISFLSSFS